MKVTIITSCGAWGGAEVATAGLANRLDERGHQVTLVTYGKDVFRTRDWGRRPGVDVRFLDPATAPISMGWQAVAAILREHSGDACVLVKPSYDHGNWRLEFLPRWYFRRFLTIEQCQGEPLLPKTSRRYLFGLLPGLGIWWYRYRLSLWLRGKGPQTVVCVSEGVKTRLVQTYGYPSKKLLTIPNGFNVERYRPDNERRMAARAAWGVPPGALVIGAVGRLAYVKGYDVALKAFARLRAERPQLDPWLVLVGEGQDGEELRAAASAGPCPDRIRFPGFTTNPWEAHPGIDIFVMPSRIEGLPLSLVEAMGCGCCPIVTDVGGNAEVVVNPSLGWVVPAGHDEAFFRALLEAADQSAEARAAMSRHAAEHARAHFDERSQFDRISDLIEAP